MVGVGIVLYGADLCPVASTGAELVGYIETVARLRCWMWGRNETEPEYRIVKNHII